MDGHGMNSVKNGSEYTAVTEDDTFRLLTRLPFDKINENVKLWSYHKIGNENKTFGEFLKNYCGWTYEEWLAEKYKDEYD